eukprot:s250_g20.t1
MNWIIPDKFLAFAGPSPTSTDADGFPAFTPEDYVPIFRDAGIGLVVRLNKKQYDRRRFVDHGLKHVDLYFLDGSCPDKEIISKFLYIVENEPSAVAVHCKAGLGRTGTLIGLYVPAPSKGRRRLHFVLRLSYIAATPESDFTDLNNWNSTLKPQEAVLRIPEIPRCLGPELVDL